MKSVGYERAHLESNKRKRRKVFKACMRCRERKLSCDGESPQCSRCVSSGAHCEYEPTRKMRGPGRKKNGTNNLESRVSLLERRLPRTDAPMADQGEASQDPSQLEQLRAIPPRAPDVETGMAKSPMDLAARLRKIYPVFLHPENTKHALEDLMAAAQDDKKSPQGFASLVSQDLIGYMLENTYDDITRICPIFDLPTLKRLNSEQQALSSNHPAGNAARWAILSTWTAIAVHLKTVGGSEAEFSLVIKGYYHNATMVLPDLILKPASTETIRALLLMATFADSVEDHRSFVMLLTNAARQLELLSQSLSCVLDRLERETTQRLLSFARLQDRKLAEKYGLTSILNQAM